MEKNLTDKIWQVTVIISLTENIGDASYLM